MVYYVVSYSRRILYSIALVQYPKDQYRVKMEMQWSMDNWWFEDDDDCDELLQADRVYDWDRFESAVLLDIVYMNRGRWTRKEH